MYKSYKYRLYPNKKQAELIQKTFGCARFVYNQCLAHKIDKYKNESVNMSCFDLNKWCNHVLKEEYEWLREVDKWAIGNAIRDMDSAYKNFFERHTSYPKFKSKHHSKKSYRTTRSNPKDIDVDFINNKVKLPKLSWVKCVCDREFTGVVKSATISQVPSGKYYISICVDTEHKPLPQVDGMVGIDLGIKDLVITSNGDKIDNIRTTKKYEDKLAKEQRKLAHKKLGSKNYEKQRIKVAKAYEKIHNTRLHYLHNISHKLINENQVIVSEDLAISNMIQNHNLAKAILDCGWYELTRQLEYKAQWNNRQYIKIGRFEPTSQRCNCCGYINKDTKDLKVRKWTCPNCHTVHDRDINASINILNEGLKLINIEVR